jgi:hypothetical protein
VIRDQAAAQLENMRQQINELNAALRIDLWDIELPPFGIPSPELTGEGGLPPRVRGRGGSHTRLIKLRFISYDYVGVHAT